MHIDKTHECHPSGSIGCGAGTAHSCLVMISNITWYPGILEITVDTCGFAPQALGHFTFHDDSGHNIRFFSAPQFVNCQHCENSESCQVTGQYTSNWTFDASQTPQNGIYYDIWVSLYWDCTTRDCSSILYASQDVHYRNIVN
ncbi:hypothetical protein C2G38_2157700 [Gigaspora rosea]|uniref:Uncharacterized protein n=1 Tax=Gigaspora rosea TaxID=44941 RepID=A0A397W4L4_9GLOM|nr:hypothetical protein C2G38_2157700 [Gigaspora rosea]CAG8515062.1 4936_t:CDS:1 [Gigaspora rosea]